MKPVIQLEPTGCGIASVAAIIALLSIKWHLDKDLPA